MRLYEQVTQFVNKSFGKASLPHFERTAYWTKQLKPDADEAMLIAAYAHDIERASRKEDVIRKQKRFGFESKEVLENHQRIGAKTTYDFLISKGANENLARRIKELILNHEHGGTEDQNVIMDADSISYFENNAMRHLDWISKGFSKETIKRKFDHMYNRISSDKAKQFAQKGYKKAIKALERQ